MAATQQMLTDAREAYHRLQLGYAVAECRDQNGDMVRYSAADRQQLYLYIQRLEAELNPTPGGIPRPRGPAGFIF